MKKLGLISITILSLLSGCSALYNGQRDVARNACEQLAGIEERITCRQRNAMPYEEYERQRQQLHNQQQDEKALDKDNSALCFKRQSTGQLVCPN